MLDAARMKYIFLSFLDGLMEKIPEHQKDVKDLLTEIMYQSEIESLDLDDWLFYEN